MGPPRGHPKWGGRPKGQPNKATVEQREIIESAFSMMGDLPTFAKWAKENQTQFSTLIWARLLPRDVKLSGEVTLQFTQRMAQAEQRLRDRSETCVN